MRGGRPSRRTLLGVAAAMLAVLGVGAVGVAVASQVGPPQAPPVSASAGSAPTALPTPVVTPGAAAGGSSGATVSGTAATGTTATGTAGTARPSATASAAAGVPPLAASKPTRLTIPAIGVDTALIGLGLQSDGTMQVPDGPTPAGWYTGGPTPGAVGPAVLAGHVTWNGAKGVFYRLGELEADDTISVRRADGRTAVFTVTGVRTYPKDAFPTGLVYGNTDNAALRLITCAGDYDAAHHHYPDNVVVYAAMTAVS